MKWIKAKKASDVEFQRDEFSKMIHEQRLQVLQILLDHVPLRYTFNSPLYLVIPKLKMYLLSIEKIEALDKIYKIGDLKNSGVRELWILIGLKSKWAPAVNLALELVSEIGKTRTVTKLYK